MLPESQLDRFMLCMTIGYPSLEDEIEIAKGKSSGASIDDIDAVITARELLAIREAVRDIFVHDRVYHYLCSLVKASRESPYVELGISPRGTIALVNMAKANAFLSQRNYVIPEDVAEIFSDVASHRILLNAKARAGHISAKNVLAQILEQEKMPAVNRRGML